jgi:hypothetical protein
MYIIGRKNPCLDAGTLKKAPPFLHFRFLV